MGEAGAMCLYVGQAEFLRSVCRDVRVETNQETQLEGHRKGSEKGGNQESNYF